MWGIAIRRLVSRLRTRRDVVLLRDPETPGAASLAVEDELLQGVEYGDLGRALAALSPEMRAVIQATVLDGLTTREAARLLGIPQNTVKTRVHRAKAHLRASLLEGPRS
jgi:RNA polymerase sigma-70 factor (ECF subfamily)